MFRSWPWWLSLILLALSLGWFWVLSQGLTFSRVEPEKSVPAKEAQ